jgi:hypothetical protein
MKAKCPHCTAHLEIPADLVDPLVDHPLKCCACGRSFHVNGSGFPVGQSRGDNIGESGSLNALGPAGGARQAAEPFLEVVEDCLQKMLRGVFIFIFVRLPKLIYDTLLAWIPTVTRLIKIAFMFVTWLFVTVGPVVWATRSMLPTQTLSWLPHVHPPLPEPVATFRPPDLITWQVGIALLWMVLAFIGSCWGIVYLRRKRREDAASVQRKAPA